MKPLVGLVCGLVDDIMPPIHNSLACVVVGIVPVSVVVPSPLLLAVLSVGLLAIPLYSQIFATPTRILLPTATDTDVEAPEPTTPIHISTSVSPTPSEVITRVQVTPVCVMDDTVE